MKNKKYRKIAAILLCLILIREGRRPLYQLIWGSPGEFYPEAGNETFSSFDKPQLWMSAEFGGYQIQYLLRKKYSVRGRVVYVDWYDGLINTWYHSAANEGVKLYNAVAVVDVSIVHGKTAEDGNWQKIKFGHEERALTPSYQYKDHPIINDSEINNNHVIPASTAVRRGIAIVKTGEIVEMEGYLMDWKGTEKFGWFSIETATEPGELYTKQLYGGVPGAVLCRQFYVTKICFAGYCFK